jgi:hypothetical protein
MTPRSVAAKQRPAEVLSTVYDGLPIDVSGPCLDHAVLVDRLPSLRRVERSARCPNLAVAAMAPQCAIIEIEGDSYRLKEAKEP